MRTPPTPVLHPSRLALLAAVAGGSLVALVAGCQPRVDARAAEVCRSAIPALNPDGARIKVNHTGSGRQHDSIRVLYSVTARDTGTREREIVCLFEPDGQDGRKRISGVATERGPLSDASFYFLRRFYIEQPDDGSTGTAVEAFPPPRFDEDRKAGRGGGTRPER